MPFFSQAGIDAFINNQTGSGFYRHEFTLSLHTGDVPSLTNELSAVSAPGYARQRWDLGGTDNTNPPRFTGTSTVTFGPATGAWPEVRSIGLRASTGGTRPPGGDTTLVAYHTLPDDQRFTLPNGLTHDIDRSHLYMTLPPRGAASLGWHGRYFYIDDFIGLPSAARVPSAERLDPGGSWDVNHPGTSSARSIEWGDRYGQALLQFTLYPRNPLVAPTSLSQPLRIGENIYRTSTLLERRNIPFYWSPTLHALVNYTPIVTPADAAGTATHWALWDGDPGTDVGRLMFLGEVTPAIALAQGEGVSFGRRAVRAGMDFASL